MHIWAADERLQGLWAVECTKAFQVIKCNALFKKKTIILIPMAQKSLQCKRVTNTLLYANDAVCFLCDLQEWRTSQRFIVP